MTPYVFMIEIPTLVRRWLYIEPLTTFIAKSRLMLRYLSKLEVNTSEMVKSMQRISCLRRLTNYHMVSLYYYMYLQEWHEQVLPIKSYIQCLYMDVE